MLSIGSMSAVVFPGFDCLQCLLSLILMFLVLLCFRFWISPICCVILAGGGMFLAFLFFHAVDLVVVD